MNYSVAYLAVKVFRAFALLVSWANTVTAKLAQLDSTTIKYVEIPDSTGLIAQATGTKYKKIFVLNDTSQGGGFSEYTYSPTAGLKLVATY